MVTNRPLIFGTALYALTLALVSPILVLSASHFGSAQFAWPLYGLWAAALIGLALTVAALVQGRRARLRRTGQVLVLIATGISATGVGLSLFGLTSPLLVIGGVLMLRPRAAAPELSATEVLRPRAAASEPSATEALAPRGGFAQQKPWLKQLNAGQLTEWRLPYRFYRSTDTILLVIPLVIGLSGFTLLTIFLSTLGRQQPGSMQAMTLSMTAILGLFTLITLGVWQVIRRTGRPVVSLTPQGLTYRHHRRLTTVPWTAITHVEGRMIESVYNGAFPFYFVCVADPTRFGVRPTTRAPWRQKLARVLGARRPVDYQAELPGTVLVIPLRWLGVQPNRFDELVRRSWTTVLAQADH